VLFSPGWRAASGQGSILAFFTAGLLLGGALSGLAVWLLSGLSEPIPQGGRAAAVAAVAATGVLREFGVLRLSLPQNARQIPLEVLQRRPRLGPMQFGFELGTGVRTYVTSSAPYMAALALLLSHPALAAATAAGLGFGLGRALTAATVLWSRDPEWNARAAARMPLLTRLAVTALAAALLTAAVG